MSREVDRLAQPVQKKKMRLVVASCSRTGTLGLHEALEMLGYTPYHMIDVMYKGRKPHMKIFCEGIKAHHDRFSGIKRYETQDLQKWLSDYDCVLEIPSYIGPRCLEAYAADPDVKFIVTERSPIKWAKSMNNTVGAAIMLAAKFPMNILRRFDSELSAFWHLADVMYWAYSDSTNPGDPNNEEILCRNYVDYIQTVKNTLPKDRLLVVKLEEGLGWEQICPFLELPIPEQKYPRGNDPETFQKIVEDWLQPRVKAALLNLGGIVTATAGIAGYLGWRYLRYVK
ncbi:P-loop containing nucleoside triphosphate hydrolase protein [Aspergillus ambiguus]|uniref:sulfotransferase family protein n=1 Tax=Aspergillus ambiguus TaxID=176160 RepID=UPI003CCE497A